MHKLLATQIKRHLKALKEIPPEWRVFMEAVSLGYEDADDDYDLMERAMRISSEELMEKNSILSEEVVKRKKAEDKLKKINLELENRVEKRTKELHLANDELEVKIIKLNENESRLQTIMDSVIDGIITIDEGGIIESINPAAERIFGYKTEQLIGKNVTLIMPESFRVAHEDGRRRAKETGELRIIGQYLEVEGLKKDGLIFPLAIAINRMKLQDRYVFTGILRDITNQKQKELELVQAKDEAERANHAKSDFLSSMSHELRTPMNAILGFSQLLTSNTTHPMSATQKIQAREILNAGEHLMDLINGVLDLSEIESGSLSLSIENLNIADLVEDTLSLIAPLAEKKSIQIYNETKGRSDVWVLGDPVRLKQVLLNLFSNAIKYTDDQGKVTLSLSEPQKGMMSLTVTDTGIGIPAEKMGSMFKPFNRLGAEYTEVEGTGMGLCITKRLIIMMNGTIAVESTLGKGSAFSIQIPEGNNQDHLSPEKVSACQSEREKINATVHKVLYVEDNPANLRLVEQIFVARDDIELLSAPEAKLGIEIARHHRPKLILLDINLPEIDGFTALKYLKTFKETRSIPVIAISANASQADIDKALGAGFEAYVTKPIKVDIFIQTIDRILHTSSQPTD